MQFDLTPAQSALQGRARELARGPIAERAAEIDRTEQYPWDRVDLLKEAGFFGMMWFERLQEYARGLLASGAPVVLAGDYNVMPTELDVYAPERWVDDALFRPEVREAFRRLTGQGWTDALRVLHPNERIYTFWKYFRNAFARDAGLRIDHLLLSPSIADRLVAAGVDRGVRGREHASDHAPAWVEITDAKSAGSRPRRRFREDP